MTVEIVVFYADAPGRTLPPGSLGGAEQIRLLYKSASQAMPNHVFTILTSPQTDLSALDFKFRRISEPIDQKRIMYERTRIQTLYLARRDWSIPAALLDTDILIAKDFTEIFQQPIDVGLTWRYSRDMPFNGGVIFINNRNPDACIRFFRELENVYSQQQLSMLEWYGDQHALATIVGHWSPSADDLIPINHNGVTVGFFSCDTYNYTPRTQTRALLGVSPKAKLLHFKGSSRRLMLPYWQLKIGKTGLDLIANLPALLWTVLRLRIGKSTYQAAVRDDGRRFYNCGDQKASSWLDRADMAAELVVTSVSTINGRPKIADLGCGDRKLAYALVAHGQDVIYEGYDLHPQSAEIHRFDIISDTLPNQPDVIAVLGVFEYLQDARGVLARLRRLAPRMVVSHVAGELDRVTGKADQLNWVPPRSTGEFAEDLTVSGWLIEEHRRTSDGKTNLWLCRVPREEESS